MDWDTTDNPLGKISTNLPILFDSVQIDKEVKSRAILVQSAEPVEGIKNPATVIAKHFPHIVARIREFWGLKKDMEEYLNQLVFLDRNSRHGFPADVITALMNIWQDHAKMFAIDHCPHGIKSGFCDRCAQREWMQDPRLHKAFKKLEQEMTFVRRKGLTGAEAVLLDQKLTEEAKIRAAREEVEATCKPMSLTNKTFDL